MAWLLMFGSCIMQSDRAWVPAGASGYVGSVVLEQLLRFAPDVARIYLLIRGKRGNSGAAALSASNPLDNEYSVTAWRVSMWSSNASLVTHAKECAGADVRHVHVCRGAAARQLVEEGSLLQAQGRGRHP